MIGPVTKEAQTGLIQITLEQVPIILALTDGSQILTPGRQLEWQLLRESGVFVEQNETFKPWSATPIFVRFATIFGVYARLETLYTHMTFARSAQGLAALYH